MPGLAAARPCAAFFFDRHPDDEHVAAGVARHVQRRTRDAFELPAIPPIDFSGVVDDPRLTVGTGTDADAAAAHCREPAVRLQLAHVAVAANRPDTALGANVARRPRDVDESVAVTIPAQNLPRAVDDPRIPVFVDADGDAARHVRLPDAARPAIDAVVVANDPGTPVTADADVDGRARQAAIALAHLPVDLPVRAEDPGRAVRTDSDADTGSVDEFEPRPGPLIDLDVLRPVLSRRRRAEKGGKDDEGCAPCRARKRSITRHVCSLWHLMTHRQEP